MFNLHSKRIVMKKLLLVALVAVSGFSMVEARRGGCRSMSCETKTCAPVCEPKQCAPKCCIGEPVIVCSTVSETCGEMPQLCSLKPVRVHVNKHTDIIHTFSCAERGPCEVIPTQAQVDALVEMGAVPAGTQPCSR